jgi:hypothetical protein
VPDLVKDWLEPPNVQIKAIAKYLRLGTNVLFCGCGIRFPVALEGALKLKEISHIHAGDFTAAEIEHGPLALAPALEQLLLKYFAGAPWQIAGGLAQAQMLSLRKFDAREFTVSGERRTGEKPAKTASASGVALLQAFSC